MRAASIGLCILSALGCGDKGDGDTGDVPAPDYTGDETGSGCEGTAPVIDQVWLENSGIASCEAGEEWPTLTVWVDVSDEDGDITVYELSLWYDETEDGSVDREPSRELSQFLTPSSGECTTKSATGGIIICMAGGIPHDTLLEWGAVVTDAAGIESEMATVAGFTPTSTGEDGGP